MKDKLEFKHIAPYLPYKLECHLMGEVEEETEFNDNPIPKVFTIDGASQGYIDVWSCKTMTDEWIYEEVFPILHPLSDLTKEIEGITLHKIIPLQKLCRNHAYIEQYSKNWSFGERCGIYFASAVDSIMTRLFEYNSKSKYFILSNPRDKEVFNCSQFDAFSQLFEWHFDVFGLINKGLAVDINTLNNKQ